MRQVSLVPLDGGVEGGQVRVLGIDLGTRKYAFVHLEGDDQSVRVIDVAVGQMDASPNHFHVVHWMREQASHHTHGVDHVYIELPLRGRGGVKVATQMAMNAGAIATAFTSEGLPVNGANVQTWKRETVGRGNAGKLDVAEWLEASHPAIHRECGRVGAKHRQDAIDAACIGLYGLVVLGRSTRLDE